VNFLSSMPSFERLHDYIIALSLATARMTGMILIMPAFARLGLSGIMRGATALAFALPLVPMVITALAGQQLTGLTIFALMPKEVAIGMMVGIVLGLPIWAAEAAGDILDLQRGSTAASLFAASGAGEASITGTLLALIMVALYFGFGGLPLALRTIYQSYGMWPIVNVVPTLSPVTGEFFLALLDGVILMGLMLVAPIVVFMLLADLLLALVSRATPNLNVFALSLSVKNLVFALLLVLYGAFLFKYMGDDLNSLLHAGSDIEKLARPAAR
jgi:type III secretion protein T